MVMVVVVLYSIGVLSFMRERVDQIDRFLEVFEDGEIREGENRKCQK